jgi:hypothetical protein
MFDLADPIGLSKLASRHIPNRVFPDDGITHYLVVRRVFAVQVCNCIGIFLIEACNPEPDDFARFHLAFSRSRKRIGVLTRQLFAVKGSIIWDTSVMLATGIPLSSACFWIVASSFAR